MRRIAFVLFFLLTGLSAQADDDHEIARRAVQEGQIRPLTEILTRTEAHQSGRLVGAKLERERGILVYELKFLGADGRVTKRYYDAASGEPIEPRGRERRP